MLTLEIFTPELEHVGTVDEIASLIWTLRYFNNGELSLLVPVTDNNSEQLQIGRVVTKHDGSIDYVDSDANIWHRAMVITYKHITKDANGLEQIECKGYTLSWLLHHRVITPKLVTSATCQNIINTLVTNNVGSGASEKRQFPQFYMLDQEDLGGSTVDYSCDEYADLADTVSAVAVSGKIGYDILIDERNQRYGFLVYKGEDLTAGNSAGNQPCIFSRDSDNVNDQSYENSIDSKKNFIYVLGGTDSDQATPPKVTVDEENATGFSLMEMFSEASDISKNYTDDSGNTQTLTDDQVTQMLIQRGQSDLDGNTETLNFASTINTRSNLTYKVDYDLGDVVTCIDRSWGLKIDARITEISESYEKGKNDIVATFGESAPTLIDKLKRRR